MAPEPLWPERRAGCRLDVVGLGECSIDHVCTVRNGPTIGAKRALAEYAQLPGGQVATALLACARLGLRTSFVGVVGDDEAAERVLAPLRNAGVEVAGVRRVAGSPTRLAVILLDGQTGERTVLCYRDPSLRLRAENLPPETIERTRALHLDAEHPEAAIAAARRARELGVPVLLDADTLAPQLEELLRLVDFPIVPGELAEALSATGSVHDGLDRMLRLGARLAVATLGEIGAIGRDRGGEIRSPGFRVDARDTTGAGDVFHAAFVWGLLAGLSADETLRAANAAAALSCQALGAQGGLPTQSELEAFLRDHAPPPWRGPA